MAHEETHGLGYEHVDVDPNVEVLLDTMDATSAWAATQELRTWEREQLDLRGGQRLLDVGCGLGTASIALAEALGPEGLLVGVDASTEMIRQVTRRAAGTACRVRFEVGDAARLDEPDRAFDAARTERTLQWLQDPQAAVDELARVVRPGGLISLIDTDWSTLSIDVDDPEVAQAVTEAMRDERGRPSNIGRRLAELAVRAGANVVAEQSAVQNWDDWNPDTTPVPTGCFSMSSLADDLIERQRLDPTRRRWFVDTIHEAARNGTFDMSLTMHAVVARTGV